MGQGTSPNQPARNHHDYSTAGLLDVAERLFLERGFAGVQLEELAREARTAKRTIYKQFGDKAGLFRAVVNQLTAELRTQLPQGPASGRDVREELIDFSARLLDAALSERALAIHRLMAAEARHFPELAQDFYEAAPGRSVAALSEYLGRLDGRWPDLSTTARSHAEAMYTLTLGELHRRALLGVDARSDAAQRRALAEQAVNTILTALGPPRDASPIRG